jgi:hypothetical protein
MYFETLEDVAMYLTPLTPTVMVSPPSVSHESFSYKEEKWRDKICFVNFLPEFCVKDPIGQFTAGVSFLTTAVLV